MKAQILKIAGLPNTKKGLDAFYKEYKTEKAFMAKHGKAFKSKYGVMMKAQEGGISPYIGAATDIVAGIGELGAQREAVRESLQERKVSDVNVKAAESIDVDAQNQFSRTMQQRYDTTMQPVNGEELFPVNGVGTNVLAKRGASVKGYAQNGFMQNVGDYFKKGESGEISGFNKMMTKGGGAGLLNKVTSGITGDDAGSQIGGGIGKGVGTALFGPLGGIGGEALGKIAGGIIDRSDNKIKKNNDVFDNNINKIQNANFGNYMQNQNRAYVESGGTIYNDGGDVVPLSGGDVKTEAYNPYTDGGETGIITGKSHAEGGVMLDYAGNKIEAQGNEPFIKMQEGGQAENLVIFGDMPITKETASLIGDDKARGKQFQTYVKDIAKNEEKINKTLKSISNKKRMYEGTSTGVIEEKTRELRSKGADMKLKKYAELKENAGGVQQAIHETADELGVEPKLVAKGGDSLGKKINSINKKNRKSLYAQEGVKIPLDQKQKYLDEGWLQDKENPYRLYKEGKDDQFVEGIPGKEDSTETVTTEGISPIKDTYDGSGGYASDEDWSKFLASKQGKEYTEKYITGTPSTTSEVITEGTKGIPDITIPGSAGQEMFFEGNKKDKFNPIPLINSVLPHFRKSDAERLKGDQLYGEMFALSHNKLEPVQARQFKPTLNVPYDISFQDQLNRNTSNIRGAQKMGVGAGNPASQAMAQAQNYSADQNVLANQFRANQEKKDQVYSGNRSTLNDAQLKNLAIMDQQYVRQETAKSNTKNTTQSALNSISDKYAKNRLEQRELKTWENMYNYRFGKNYVAKNRNGLVDFNAMLDSAQSGKGSGTGGMVPTYSSKTGSQDGWKYPNKNKKETHSRHGSLVKAFKHY